MKNIKYVVVCKKGYLFTSDKEDIIEFLQNDRKQWINQFTQTHNESVKIQKENQELKKHLEVPETCNLKTLEDYKSYYVDTAIEQILADTYIEYCAYVNLAHRYSELNKQVDYIRSGEYLNQLKFERNMLEEIVEHGELSKEDKEFIDMTHRNTELLEENEKLKLQLSSTTFCYDEEEHKKLKKQLEEYKVTTEDTKNFVKCLYTGGYISEMTKNNILDRLGD